MGYVSNPKHDFGIDYQDVSFPSHNPATPYTLRGWHVPSTLSDAKVGLILLHGASIVAQSPFFSFQITYLG
jgi:hypothetical protein